VCPTTASASPARRRKSRWSGRTAATAPGSPAAGRLSPATPRRPRGLADPAPAAAARRCVATVGARHRATDRAATGRSPSARQSSPARAPGGGRRPDTSRPGCGNRRRKARRPRRWPRRAQWPRRSAPVRPADRPATAASNWGRSPEGTVPVSASRSETTDETWDSPLADPPLQLLLQIPRAIQRHQQLVLHQFPARLLRLRGRRLLQIGQHARRQLRFGRLAGRQVHERDQVAVVQHLLKPLGYVAVRGIGVLFPAVGGPNSSKHSSATLSSCLPTSTWRYSRSTLSQRVKGTVPVSASRSETTDETRDSPRLDCLAACRKRSMNPCRAACRFSSRLTRSSVRVSFSCARPCRWPPGSGPGPCGR